MTLMNRRHMKRVQKKQRKQAISADPELRAARNKRKRKAKEERARQ